MASRLPTLPNGAKEPTDGNPWDEFGRPFTEEEEMEIQLYCYGVLDRISAEQARFQAFRKIGNDRLQQIDANLQLISKQFKEDGAHGDLHLLFAEENELTTRSARLEPAYDRLVEKRKAELRLGFQHQLWANSTPLCTYILQLTVVASRNSKESKPHESRIYIQQIP